MTFGGRVHCMFCLNPLAAEIKQDRNGRPYLICHVCGLRAFLKTEMSLRGPSQLWGPLVRALQAGDVDAAQVMLEREGVKAKEDFDRELQRDAQLVAK
jgi:hypothetical protein